jgi:nitronate monooxygenase
MNFTELRIGDLVCSVPIIQGGMGVGISMSGLAAAVANEGGIGVVAGAMIGISEPDVSTNPIAANVRALKQVVRKTRTMTSGVIGVNIMVALTHYADLVKAAIEEGIDIIFSGAGLPMDLPGYLPEGARTKLVPIISSARAAGLICKKWIAKFDRVPDAFVVEGPMAGGHLGFKIEQIDDPDFAIEKLIVEVMETTNPIAADRGVTIPIIAAGGIFTGADIHRFLNLGAAGVQMATRFVTTHECDASPEFKQTYLDAEKEDLIIIKSPVGMPGRALRNQFLEEVEAGNKKPFNCPYHCVKTCDPQNSPYCIAIALASARKGRFRHGFAFAGSNAYRIDKIVSVKELIDSLRTEFSEASSG